MRHIFAPWRIRYIQSPKYEGCIFCDFPSENRDEERLILLRGKWSFIIMNTYPYNPGHVMIAPYAHKADLEELTREEIYEIFENSKAIMEAIRKTMNPDGFNLGINMGKVAGAGIEDHIHLHIVPRWDGDTNFMPVLADTRVIPEALEETYSKLRAGLRSI